MTSARTYTVEEISMPFDAPIVAGRQYSIAEPGHIGRVWWVIIAPEGISNARHLLDLFGVDTFVVECDGEAEPDNLRTLN
jgi:hypothetical protein